jgi:RNA recognition motif-containing protein
LKEKFHLRDDLPPGDTLYIKNLGKKVDEDDLRYVFGCLFSSEVRSERVFTARADSSSAQDAVRVGLRIKLMDHGRMRGQGFITFPSQEVRFFS